MGISILGPGALISSRSDTVTPSSQPVTSAGTDDGATNVGLAIARNLARIYTDVLEAPVPTDLQHLIQKWESCHIGESK